ncbi:hypothetical protein JTE90_013065 [Oedothorax gibbosus]|nr:hypothetical protein JTE90_013065 [Oedothorax gibbosus]
MVVPSDGSTHSDTGLDPCIISPIIDHTAVIPDDDILPMLPVIPDLPVAPVSGVTHVKFDPIILPENAPTTSHISVTDSVSPVVNSTVCSSPTIFPSLETSGSPLDGVPEASTNDPEELPHTIEFNSFDPSFRPPAFSFDRFLSGSPHPSEDDSRSLLQEFSILAEDVERSSSFLEFIEILLNAYFPIPIGPAKRLSEMYYDFLSNSDTTLLKARLSSLLGDIFRFLLANNNAPKLSKLDPTLFLTDRKTARDML